MSRVLSFFASILLLSQPLSAEEWYSESYFPHWRQEMKMDRVLYREQTEEQDLVIFENKRLGRVLALDGIIQLTEADEHVYHEMIVHVPMLTHGHVEQVLIIGGGDGGALREVLRHKNVKKAVLVEIDPSVITLCTEMFPNVSRGAFKEKRAEIVIADGAEFVRTTHERFDLIICDSTDPVGPGKVLFTEEFYGNCKRILNDRGIFVNQNGVPFLQPEEIPLTFINRSPHFQDVGYFIAAVPTYFGGLMAFGWATDCPEHRFVPIEVLRGRLGEISGEMGYYTPEVHLASFALPAFLSRLIPK